MEKQEILKLLNNSSQDKEITEELLDSLVLDNTRVIDNKITNFLQNYKNSHNVHFNKVEKEHLRKYLLGYPVKIDKKFINLDKSFFNISQNDYSSAYSLINKGIERNKDVLISSLNSKLKNVLENTYNSTIIDSYVEYIQSLEKGYNQLTIFDTKNLEINTILENVKKEYENLSNYHYIVLFFYGDWEKLSKTAIFLENFKQEQNFNVFNKVKNDRIDEMDKFLQNSQNIQNTDEIKKLVDDYYSGVSYGFQFKDLFISDSSDFQILVMQKVELDETVKKCPSCLTEKVRGNSYSKILYKSFECSNPSCPDRSKIGRGKRFDLLGAKRSMFLEKSIMEDNSVNNINDKIIEKFRRDIINFKNLQNINEIIQDLISIYSWDSDTVLLLNCDVLNENIKNREVIIKNIKRDNIPVDLFENLLIYQLFKKVSENIRIVQKEPEDKKIIDKITVYNGNSTLSIPTIEKVDAAITSPPYYNAREYSTWVNFNCYLIDMMINARTVFNSLNDGSIYIYNVGDIVDLDYNFIHSNMSKKRLMLGFYSVFILEIVGFDLLGNIVWDKGEVQSKRGSTPNKFPGYVNPINCYEHCLVFKKNESFSKIEKISTIVKKIDTVKKINNKGKNNYGHTAPYPVGVANFILDFLNSKDDVVLDPFLGSGTTCIAMNLAGYHSVGFELDKNYYNLSIEKIKENFNFLTLFK